MDQVVAPEQAVSSSTPNLYEFTGGDIHVSFSESSFSGEPLMSYRDSHRQVNARGKEIQQVDMGIGKLVTLTLAPNADAGALLFSVVIPHARLVAPADHVDLHTVGITTRTGGFILNTAQLDKYSVVKLRGTGRSVDF